MPNYEYKCKDCGALFALLQSIWARRKGAKCPECGSENTEREISNFNSGGGSCNTNGMFG